METIGAFEAKTHLSSLLDRVAKGERITITRHGIPAALLVPVGSGPRKLSHREIVDGMRELRSREASRVDVRTWVAEGRRY
jgi:prevent-host-death family protein